MIFILTFFLFIGVAVAFTPQMAKQIAYSWNIGIERARAEIARQFLDEHPLSSVEQRTAWVAKAVAPSVVGVHAIVSRASGEYSLVDERRGDGESLGFDIGSGVIIDARGYILTNQHVIAGAHAIRVQLSDGRVADAELIGQDREIDLAVLRIDASDLRAIDWGDSRQVVVGERVLAIGSPFNLQQTFTSGIISATERYSAIRIMRGPRHGGRMFPHAFLQTDATINPGNSGGALVDMNGRLIGICTSTFSLGNGGNTGIGFAIPSCMAKHVYEEIISRSEVRRGWIGVELDELIWHDLQQMGQDRPRGTIITRLWRGSPASVAGLRRLDIILRWGETEITGPLHLIHLVTLTPPGTVVPVEVFRRGETLTFEITVGSRPMDL
jgi:serine protease DegS